MLDHDYNKLFKNPHKEESIMSTDYSYLTQQHEEEPLPTDTVPKVVMLCKKRDQIQEELDNLERMLSEKKKQYNKIDQELIPEALMNSGVNRLVLADGRSVSYKPEVKASIKDHAKFVKFLERRGDDDIIKTNFDVGKLPANIINSIMKDLSDKYGLAPRVKQDVHWKTLSSYVGKICGLAKNSKASVNIGDLDKEGINTYVYNKTTVK